MARISVFAGDVGTDIESRPPILVSATCDGNGRIGSLVLTPSGARDAELAIHVIAGVTHKPEDCRAAAYDGCVCVSTNSGCAANVPCCSNAPCSNICQ
jgi:hypothetical protein